MGTLPSAELAAEVRALIAAALCRRVGDVQLGTALDASGLDLDSLGFTQLNVVLEERFDITLPDLDSHEAGVRTVADVVSLVATRIASKRAAMS